MTSEPRQYKPNYLYFIRSEIGGPIKIGQTTVPRERLRVLQTGSPFILRFIALTESFDFEEKVYHAKYGDSRLHGEWFEATDDLLAEAERIGIAEST